MQLKEQAMEHFWLKRSMMNEVPEVAGLLIRLNLKRSWVAIAVIILIQLVSTISGVIQVYPNYVLGNILVGVWCVLFALYMLIFYQNHLDENEKIARWCCIVFWAVLGMVMIQFTAELCRHGAPGGLHCYRHKCYGPLFGP